ncbi:MAG TPA: NAD-binding protein, partial [Turneriella sp.]|nr:NAD-binding protein [Turneriella sp.]
NLSNVSEFSLVIAALGLASGHISSDILSIIIFTFVITSIFAPYMIKYNQQLQGKITGVFEMIGLRDKQKFVEPTEQELNKDIALLGFFKVASSFVTDAVEDTGKNSLKEKIVVVDFNQTVHSKLKSLGIPAVYGDIGHIDTLHHVGLHHTKVAISTIPDTILVGTSNTKLIKQIEDIAPHAKIIVTAENPESALKMYEAGADYVFLPRQLASAHLMPIVRDMLATTEEGNSPAAKSRRKKAEAKLEQLREDAISELRERHEIIA